MSSALLVGLPTMPTITRLQSISLPVADQDRALAYYVDVLGCTLRADVEIWPGVRWVEVVPPGTEVGLALLDPGNGLPMGVRFGTADADAAHGALTTAGAAVDEEVLRLDPAPPMFTFTDPDGNVLLLIEDQPGGWGD